MGMKNLPGRGLTGTNQTLQTLPFFTCQPNHIAFAHADWGGESCPYTLDDSGNEHQHTRGDEETWNRTIQFVEVLDYDNEGTDKAIVIYKKVEISHLANFDYEASGIDPITLFYTNEVSLTEWQGTRNVTYWAWVKIGSTILHFQLSQTFAGLCQGKYDGSTQNQELQTGSGQRVYGVSCQINNDYILYSFLVEDFIGGDLGSYDFYSSPINWEDRDRIGKFMTGEKAWKKNKLILGVINMAGQKASFDITNFSADTVYSVGIHEYREKRMEGL